ncbi:MAG: KH domain-containing protein [Candidatus Paceibacterota bacterium]
MMATTVNIPSEDIKGKIIGKEGRNIRAFERSSGVELIVDDTRFYNSFCLLTRLEDKSLRLWLENLIIDGRIQPAKIEEMVAKSTRRHKQNN